MGAPPRGLAQEIALRRSDLAEDDARAAGLDRIAADLEHLRGFALPLIERLAALPTGAPWSMWLDHPASSPPSRFAGRTACSACSPSWRRSARSDRSASSWFSTCSRRGSGSWPSPPRPGPAAASSSPRSRWLAGLEFDTVFVPGLAEKLFPPRILEDPLLPDESRRTLQRLARVTQDSLSRATGLRSASRPERRALHALSWPRVDAENARARVPSFYGLEALRAMEGRLPGFDELRGRSESGGTLAGRMAGPRRSHASRRRHRIRPRRPRAAPRGRIPRRAKVPPITSWPPIPTSRAPSARGDGGGCAGGATPTGSSIRTPTRWRRSPATAWAGGRSLRRPSSTSRPARTASSSRPCTGCSRAKRRRRWRRSTRLREGRSSTRSSSSS